MKSSEVFRNQVCPLCEFPAQSVRRDREGRLTTYVECVRCNQFGITDQALEELEIRTKEKYLLSAVCRNWLLEMSPTILTTNIDSLIRQAPKLGVSEKLD